MELFDLRKRIEKIFEQDNITVTGAGIGVGRFKKEIGADITIVVDDIQYTLTIIQHYDEDY